MRRDGGREGGGVGQKEKVDLVRSKRWMATPCVFK